MAIGEGERAEGAAEPIPDERWDELRQWFVAMDVKQERLIATFTRLTDRVDVLAGLVFRQQNTVAKVVDTLNEFRATTFTPMADAVTELRHVRGTMERALQALDAQRGQVQAPSP